MTRKHQALICHTLHKMNKKNEQEKRMPVSFMKMNNSHKRRCKHMQKKLENNEKHLQKQVEQLLQQIMKSIQK